MINKHKSGFKIFMLILALAMGFFAADRSASAVGCHKNNGCWYGGANGIRSSDVCPHCYWKDCSAPSGGNGDDYADLCSYPPCPCEGGGLE